MHLACTLLMIVNSTQAKSQATPLTEDNAWFDTDFLSASFRLHGDGIGSTTSWLERPVTQGPVDGGVSNFKEKLHGNN